jgi:fibronectin-binding autotransporter adhesin
LGVVIRRTSLVRRALLLAVVPLVLAAPAARAAGAHPDATTLTWTGTNSCQWGDGQNWSPHQVPQNGDSVALNGGGPHPDPCNTPTIDLDQLSIGGGTTVSGTGSQLSANNVAWTSGTLLLSLEVRQSLTMTNSGGTYRMNDDGQAVSTLTTDGSTTMIGGAVFHLGFGAQIVNNAGAAWGATPGAGRAIIEADTCCQPLSTFDNFGTLDGGVTGLTIQNMGYAGESAAIATGDVLVGNGPDTLKDGTDVTGGGVLQFTNGAQVAASGTITVGGGSTLQLNNATLNGKKVTFAGTGTLQWSQGTVTASPTIAHATRLVLDGSGAKLLDGTTGSGHGTLTVHGTATQSGAGAFTINGGSVVTAGDGVWIVPASQDVLVRGIVCCATASPWRNVGQLRVASGSTFDFSNALFNNLGVVTGGGTFDLGIGPHVFSAGSTVSGGTTMILDRGGSITGHGTLNLKSGSSLDLEGNGTLAGTINLKGSGSFTWSRGSVSGNLDVGTGVATRIVDLGADASHGRALTATGATPATLTIEGGALQDSPSLITVGGADQIINGTSSTWTIDNGGMSAGVCCANPANFLNEGTIDVEASGGSAALTLLQFTNTGTLRVGAGTLSFSALAPIQSAGSTVVDGTLSTGQPYGLQGGTLTGSGTVTGSITNGAGTVSAGDPIGTLHVTGAFSQGNSGTLLIDLKNAKSDLLNVDGAFTLGGTLQLKLDQSGALSRVQRTLVNAGSTSGTWSITGLGGLGSPFKVTVTSTQVLLVPN